MSKKSIRANFRQKTFNRDGYRCVKCNTPGKDRQGGDLWKKFHKQEPIANLDAHHIIPRELMPNGGYVPENGASLCDDCHLLAESGAIPPEELFAIIKSSEELARKKCNELKQ